MQKNTKIRLLHLFISVIILTCLLPIKTYANNQIKLTLSITPNPIVGETIQVKAVLSPDVKKVTWSLTLNGTTIKNNFKKNGGTFIPSKSGTYILSCTVSGKRFSEKYTEQIIVSEDSLPEENIPADNKELSISLKAPETALTNVTFPLSISTSNCSHIEWYINGDYYSELAAQINPEGTLSFSSAGTYKITVIGYTKDWSEHVKDSKTIIVSDDSNHQDDNVKQKNRAMYSWNHDYIYESNEALLQQALELTECNILYQELSTSASKEDVADFLNRRGRYGQTVYYLCGDASWAIEKNAESMLEQVARVISYNNAADDYKFAGIQFDVEPYCLDDFEENADAYMAQYVENCKLAYDTAHEAGLSVELCIPYWWDTAYGYEAQLEDLIANACDSIAVMNYYKEKEASHLETELNLCKKYNKPIINITEMQAPGYHGLTEKNTYYHDGIEAVENMWNNLDGYFEYEKLGYSYHYLDVIIELLSLA